MDYENNLKFMQDAIAEEQEKEEEGNEINVSRKRLLYNENVVRT